MKYIIMCAGEGKRWGNYKGVPKHLIEINGETLIGRTTRMLKEYNVDYVITTSDKRYKKYGKTIPQSYNDCEIDRFEDIGEKEICYLYGDVYYTDYALNIIINTPTNGILFFGSDQEIFGIKIVNKDLFMEHKNIVKQLFLEGKIWRSIGWEVYRSLNEIPLEEHQIKDNFVLIQDWTDDIDFPSDYEKFVNRFKGGNMVKVEVTEDFTLERFGELKNIIRAGVNTQGRLYKGDVFECSKDLADYLLGGNKLEKAFVKVIELIPEKEVETEPIVEPIEEEPATEPKKTKKKSKK
ncbi:MAG: NTP transferase domain-containing protein [Methanobrevibacter sp.]|nr:NTP transferase domain-containing protein [Methanobrevibacter sp.]